MKTVQVPGDVEKGIDDLVAQGMFHSFQAAAEALLRQGLSSMRGRGDRGFPPESIPHPERPNIPDPSRDYLKM